MFQKDQRQRMLLRLVAKRTIHSQGEMVLMLKNKGIDATQASVSRDVRELDLVKVNGRYLLADRLGAGRSGDGRGTVGNELITRADPIGANLIVVRTQVGSANPVALGLDRWQSPDVAGTIAGDDTVFVAVKSRSAQGRVLAKLKRKELGIDD